MAISLNDAGTRTGAMNSALQAKKLGKGQVENPHGKLGKDEFLKLLLVELEHQDPTAPVETEKILSQTSQLASLEAATNTNKSLNKLSGSLSSSMQFTTIGAMGKIASIGNDEVILKENAAPSFELYLPRDVKTGEIQIKDNLGNIVRSIGIKDAGKGTRQFTWDGETNEGNRAKEGSYHISANYVDPSGIKGQTRVGTYPVQSIKFDNGESMLKMGSNYVPFKRVKEIYDANAK